MVSVHGTLCKIPPRDSNHIVNEIIKVGSWDLHQDGTITADMLLKLKTRPTTRD
jgi:hypothetical protein